MKTVLQRKALEYPTANLNCLNKVIMGACPDKLPHATLRLKPVYHQQYATPQLEKLLTCYRSSWTCPKTPQSLSYSHLRYIHTDLHSQISQDSPVTPGVLHIPLFSPFILQRLTSVSSPSVLLLSPHTALFLFYSKAASTQAPGSQFASYKVHDFNITTQINPPKIYLK